MTAINNEWPILDTHQNARKPLGQVVAAAPVFEKVREPPLKSLFLRVRLKGTNFLQRRDGACQSQREPAGDSEIRSATDRFHARSLPRPGERLIHLVNDPLESDVLKVGGIKRLRPGKQSRLEDAASHQTGDRQAQDQKNRVTNPELHFFGL